MEKLLLIFILVVMVALSFFVKPVNAQTITFNIIIAKPSFLRYEIMPLRVDLKQDGSPVTDAAFTAKFYNSTGNLVTTVGNIQSISLYYNSTDQLWWGYWPIPWNPNLGTYTVEVTVDISGSIYINSTQFNISMRTPRETLPPGFLAMTAEDVGDLTDFSIPGPYNENQNWLNMFEWARFMGADSFWPTVGYIAGYYYGQANQSFPWYYPGYKSSEQYCQEANNSGLRCAPWIWPYTVFSPEGAKNLYNITFNWTVYYDCSSNSLNENAGDISILDERAINHTKKMIEMLDPRPDVNTIGIDWEPSGSVDLRLVNDEFIRKMNVQVPSEWWSSYTDQDKMKWVGSRITYGCSNYNINIADVWHRWMAHNYALTLKKIIEGSGSSKSFFMYTWSSGVGRGNSHDPFIFNDAGIDIIAPMTYTVPARAGRSGSPCWYENAIVYAWGNEATFEKLPNIVAGQIVNDGAYMNCSYMKNRDYPSPEEMYDRMMISGKGMYKDGNISGLFWHDILRANGNIVGGWHNQNMPYLAIEWAVAGGAAASDLRVLAGRIPINMSIEAQNEIYYGDTLNGNITVTNLGSSSLDVTVFLINNTPGWEFISSPYTVISLSPSQTQKVPFTVKSNLRNYDVDNRFMVAAKAVWGSKSTDKHIEFKYIHAIPKSVLSDRLKDINNNPVKANVTIYQKETNTIVSSNQTDLNGNYFLFVAAGAYDIQFNLISFPIQNYSIKLKSIDMSYDFYEPIKHITYNPSKDSLSVAIDVEKPQTIYIISPKRPERILKNNTALINVSSLPELNTNKWFYNETEQKIYLMVDRFLAGFSPLFGYSQIGGSGTGYTPYIYTAGPYDVSNTATVSSIYLYTPTAGKAKVAMYDAIYNPSQYITQQNPNNLIVQSGEVSCSSNTWCNFDIADTQISPGKYFLAIKMNTNGMLSAISRAGFGQWRTHSYADPFPNPFGAVSVATGGEYSIYACCS